MESSFAKVFQKSNFGTHRTAVDQLLADEHITNTSSARTTQYG
jgi:hypothetical protein